MVVPPSAEAAMPVEAVMKVLSRGSALRMCFSSRDLPVPAQPVKKTLTPALQQQYRIRQDWYAAKSAPRRLPVR